MPDVVVSNAAVIAGVEDHPSEGIQRTLVVNHLAPYLLLRSLVKPIGDAPARFVVVGADPRALRRAPVDLDDLGLQTGRGVGPVASLRPFVAYGRTQNMNSMFVYALARRLRYTNITVNGAHPGIIKDTGLGRDSARGALRLLTALTQLNPFLPGPDAGADTPASLATSPELDGISGAFFVKRKQVRTAPHTTDPARCHTGYGTRAHGSPASPPRSTTKGLATGSLASQPQDPAETPRTALLFPPVPAA